MAAWVGWLSLAVKFMPLPKALGTLSTDLATNSNHSPQSPAKLAGHIDRVLRTDWICFKPICWKRAAVLHRYLALNGIETRVVFGMRKEQNGRVHGHAWLESNNNPILESEPPNYTVTYSFPSTTKFDLKLELLNE
jgi:transglutaminase superfamily protein